MEKKIVKPVGDRLFIKKNIKSLWESATLYELKTILSDRNTPYSKEEKLKLRQFGFGRMEGETGNTQIYPTKIIVAELDTPSGQKGKLAQSKVFDKWKSFFTTLYEKIASEDRIPYWYLYLTPSMCGLRFVIKLDNAIRNKSEYKQAVLAFLNLLKTYEIDENYFDISVNCGWYLPTYKKYFSKSRKTFEFKIAKDDKLPQQISKAIRLTEESKSFEDGNRNNFIFLLGRNANRLGIEKQNLLNHIADSDLAYDIKEINTTIDSAYKKSDEFGIWADKSDLNENATVSLSSLIKRAKTMKPIPLVWSGIKEGSLGFVFGPSKSGKSTLCECLGMSLASGLNEFFGAPLSGKQQKVLYISLEEYWEGRIERNKLQRNFLFTRFKKKFGNNYFTNNENYPTHIMTDEDLKFIEREINKCEPDIVFIDSFTRLIMNKVEDSSRVNMMMYKLKKMCKDTGATFVLIHHTIKAKDKYLSVLNMAGSRVLSQEADFLIGINRAPNGQQYLKDILFRFAREKEKVIPFEINDSRWVINSDSVYESDLITKEDGRKDDTNKQSIYDFIKTVEDQVSFADIKEHFDNEMSKKTLHNNLNKLQEEGKIEKVEKGVYKCSVDKSNK